MSAANAAGSAPAPAAGAPARRGTGPSIAVLPFLNLSGDPSQEYFSDGLSEEILDQLTQLPNLRVIGRSSSFALRGEDPRKIADTLDVNHVLEGSVRRAGDRVRITAKLIDPADGSQIWSESYERRAQDIFAVQEEIARSVAGAMKLTLDPGFGHQWGTRNLAAFEEFLAGRDALNRGGPEDMLAAAAHFDRAVELDPSYLQAWLEVRVAWSGVMAYFPERIAEGEKRFETSFARTLALAPGSPAAEIVRSFRALEAGNLVERERHLLAGLREPGALEPRVRHQYGNNLMQTGRVREAIAEFERVRAADPLNQLNRRSLHLAYLFAGESARADADLDRYGPLTGPRMEETMQRIALARAMVAHDDATVRRVSAAQNASSRTRNEPLLPEAAIAGKDDPAAALALLRRTLDESDAQALGILAPTISLHAAYLGDPELALRAAGRALDLSPDVTVTSFLWTPVLRDTRRLPGFRQVLERSTLLDYWRSTGQWGDYCKPVGKDDIECS